MKRIDIVYERLKKLSKGKGISAKTLSDSLGLNRANVSRDLNKLYAEGKVTKSNGRPVFFTPINNKNNLEVEECIFDKFAKENNSLNRAVEQAKAAILYPPRGMHALILGETGVGKSMFAELMYKYALNVKKLDERGPFITFNCADYSNNPQLLLSQLFGVKKGAYTGADSDRPGLIEKANSGILFLDEVHRLPAEGQEMFFTVMDKGTFRRLGECDIERKVNVLFISATTENPESNLLNTFTRRIPMIIKIPSLKERGFQERFNLITNFFTEESYRLNRDVKVSVNSLRALLSYNCISNIGQLKTDIQLSCAKAYVDFLNNKKEEIKINSTDLPEHVREGLYKEKEHREIWNKVIGLNHRYFTFNKEQNKKINLYHKNRDSIYEIIDEKVYELKSRGINDEELEKIMEIDIERHFTQYLNRVNNTINKSKLKSLIDPPIISVVEKVINYSETKLKKTFNTKVFLALALHIKTSIERIKNSKKIINPKLKKIRIEHKKEFNTALECLKIIEEGLDISLPIDEAGFLAMFFVLDNENMKSKINNVGVIVIAHGNSTATSMAEVANSLLDIEYAVGIDAPLETSPNEVLDKLTSYIKKSDRKSGFIFLTDMGSLTTFGDIIEKEMNIPVRVIPLVSTLHVIEATRKAVLGYELEGIYNECSNIVPFAESEIEEKNNREKKLALVTVCMTGQGSAVAIKNFLANHLRFHKEHFEIIPINFLGEEDIKIRIDKLIKEREIICIVSSFNINNEIPEFNLEQVLNLSAIKDIQEIIDLQSTYIKMNETLREHLKNVDGELVFKDVKKCIHRIENGIGKKTEIDKLIGVTLHISCMVDRLKEGDTLVEYKDKEEYIEHNKTGYGIIKSAVAFLEDEYEIEISDDEICYLMNIFK